MRMKQFFFISWNCLFLVACLGGLKNMVIRKMGLSPEFQVDPLLS